MDWKLPVYFYRYLRIIGEQTGTSLRLVPGRYELRPMYIKPKGENSVRGLPTRFATGGAMQRDYTLVKNVAAVL